MNRRILAGCLSFSGAALLGIALFDSLPRDVVIQVPDTSGHEAPLENVVNVNGYNVGNHGEARILDFWDRYKDFLGEPVSSWDGRSQMFRFSGITFNPSGPPDWQLELANAGAQSLLLDGLTPRPGSQPHPAVRDWELSQAEVGVDLKRVVGRFLNSPQCQETCWQASDKLRFEFSRNAATGDQVRLSPIGLWLTHPQTRPVSVATPQRDIKQEWPLIAAALVLLAGGLLGLRQSGSTIRTLPI